MIKIENTEVVGFEHAIRGMRNPMNSWDKSDSYPAVDCGKCGKIERDGICKKEDRDCTGYECFAIGPNDHDLMMRLRNAGTDHRKFMRMITVYVDITAPLYWLKEMDQYKVGVTSNSCSTMHRIHAKEFTWEDFSTEHLIPCHECALGDIGPTLIMDSTIKALNCYRKKYLETKDKKYWWQLIQLLPSSYNQKRTYCMNYEVLANIYKSRKTHKLDEWVDFCKWIKTELPYSEIITG